MRPVLKGSTDVSVIIRIVDSGDGTPETGVTSASGGLDLKYRREGAATANLTETDLSALTDAHSDGGLLHIGAGYYRVDVPDAAFATGANGVMVFGSVTGMVVIGCYVPLVDYNPYDGVRLGLTALPNAAAGANTGLPVVGTQVPNATAGASGGLFIAGTNAATTVTTSFTTTFTGNLTGSVASVTGAVGSVTAGVTLADGVTHGGTTAKLRLGSTNSTPALYATNSGGDAVQFESTGGNGRGLELVGHGSGSALYAAAGTSGGHGFEIRVTAGAGNAVFAYADGECVWIESGTSVGLEITAAAQGLFINSASNAIHAETSANTDTVYLVRNGGTGNILGNITGNLSGSVGSVTGAVGSVTGAVGSVTGNVSGNVAGSVGSVATGGLTAASFAAGAIDAAAIAADAIGASELAADAVAEIADAVWEEVLSGHTAVDGGAADVLASAPADVWAVATRTLTAGTNINGSTFTAIPWNASWDAEVQSEVADALTAVGLTSYTTPPTAAENADALLGRNIAGGSSTGRTVSQAFDRIRNKVTVSGTTLTVYQTDDATSSWSATLTLDAAADPVTAVDPA
jgi:hypothetical protein